ncbi:unnamed protein product [Schistosoma guineensis]|nr:unnamed protein product [Schistosoma guineensis]
MEASGEFCVYEVKPGDSLSAIAAQLGFVTPTQIARANHLPLMSYGLPPVFPGQRLIIPTAARANCSSTKIKHLPGVALRIEDMDKQNVDTTSTGFLAVQPFFYTTRVLNPNKSYPIDDDALERQFVKVNAFRVLESLDNLIDGVLLVTPESLCFDASQTAVAQKQAYIASHSELSSSDYNIDATHNKMIESHHDSDNKSSTCHDNNVEFSCCHIPQELLNLGLCIPLASIIAMKTLVENDVIHILKSECNNKINSLSNSTLQNEKTEEHVNVQSTNENTKSTDENTDNQRNDPNSSSNIDKEQPDETSKSIINDNSVGLSDSTYAVNIDEQLKTPEIPSEIETTLSTSSSVSSSPHQLPTASLETLSTSVSQLLQKENNSEDKNVTNVTNDLYLRITLIGDITHIFRLAVDRLTQVYSFLLRAGVGSLDKHIEVNNHSEQVVIGNSDKLSVNFPAYWSSSNLNSIYKSEDDGYCLNTVYRKCKDVEGSVLLLIRDTMGVVFGAVMSETMKCSKHFYGTGETFVFHWKPTFKKYCWTKKNYFFMRGSLHSFHIGGQSGRNAIWFDESLKYGCSEPTDTFDNPVLSGNLPDIQFSSLSLNKSDKNENVLIENNINNVHVNSNPLNPTIKSSSTVCDSVSFIIDTFELWQLISC